jgi:hypothetical protein
LSFAASAVNEWAIEILEKVSINDLVYTSMGTWSIGEFFFQLGDYLNSAPYGGGSGNQLAAMTLGFPRYVHDCWDGVTRKSPLPPDNLGFSSAYWHRFGLLGGVAGVDNDESSSELVQDLVVEAELVRMPGFLRPGEFDVGFDQGNFVDMRARFSFDPELVDADVRFSADIAGYYQQSFEVAPGGISGAAWSSGLNTGLRITRRRLLGREDELAVAHLFGPSLRGWVGSGGLMARASAAVHADFAGVRSLAFDEWSTRFNDDNVKSVLRNHNYYFAAGASGSASAALEYEGTELAMNAEYGRYESIEGLDREQDTTVTRDIHSSDRVLDLAASLGHTIPDAPVHIRVGVEQTKRWSSMAPVDVERWDRRASVALGLRF